MDERLSWSEGFLIHSDPNWPNLFFKWYFIPKEFCFGFSYPKFKKSKSKINQLSDTKNNPNYTKFFQPPPLPLSISQFRTLTLSHL